METLQQTFTLVTDKLVEWGESLALMLPNLAVAVLVLVAFYWLSRGTTALLKRGLGRVMDNVQVVELLATIARVAVMAAGLVVALGILDLDKTVTSLLAGVGVVGLALGFAFQDLAANFMSGIIMAVRHQFATGDQVEVMGHFGRIEAVDLRSTTLRAPTGQKVILPNRKVLDDAIVNFTADSKRRVDLQVGVAYGDDLPLVERVTREALESVEGRTPGKVVEVYFEGFGGSSIDLVGRFWIPSGERSDFMKARSEAIKAVKAAFDAHDITIPFPIRTLDFGVVGGVPLDEMLPDTTGGDDARYN